MDVNLESHDNNTDCHTFKKDLPPDTDKKNDGRNEVDNNYCKEIESKQDPELNSLTQQENQTLKNNGVSLWGSNSLEHVTVSQATKEEDIDEHKSPYHIPSIIGENDGIKNIAFKEILQVIRSKQGACIAVNYAIEYVCNNNEAVKKYLNGKLTSRENRDVRDLISNIVRHSNIDVIKQKPQLVVKWSEKNDDYLTNAKENELR
jgi:hypothetical protein